MVVGTERLPPAAPPELSAFRNPPLLVVADGRRGGSSDPFADSLSSEPELVRLPPTTFNAPPGTATAPVVGMAPGGSVEQISPEGDSSGGPMGMMTPPDGPKRRGFFARAFGPGVEAGGEMLSDIRFDYIHFYSPRSLIWLGGGIGVAAILANTSIDQHFRNWYQNDMRSPTADHIHNDIAYFGNGGYMLPIFLASGFLLTPFEEYSPAAHVVGTWGRKTTRAFLVGGPMLLALQYGLGRTVRALISTLIGIRSRTATVPAATRGSGASRS